MMAKSLVSRVESNPGVGLPVGYEHSEMSVGDPLFQQTPYAMFCSQKGDSFAKIMRDVPSLQDGDPVLVACGKAIPLNPFRFYLISAYQHFSVVDNQGVILRSTTNPLHVKKESSEKWQEHIETVLLICLPERVVPARCTFKTTKCRAAFRAIEANRTASNPETWAKLSPEHKASLVATVPWARFTATVTLKRMQSKSSGFNYVAADSFITPTGLADWNTISRFFADPSNTALCNDVREKHGLRVELVKRKLEGEDRERE